ncbi:MAG: hypothetical protein F2876_00645 [Actinobacteria bacterium]|nr:hypothetical protein [Actinomycetota bacterium]
MRDKTTKHPEFRRGLEALREARITTNVFAASIDERLNVNSFTVPGRGDAGDRQFGLASRPSGALVSLHCTRFARVDSVRPRRARCFCAAPRASPDRGGLHHRLPRAPPTQRRVRAKRGRRLLLRGRLPLAGRRRGRRWR